MMSLLIFLLPFAAAVICIGIGRYNISPAESLGILLSPLTGREVDPQGWSVIYHVRLPRILLALAVGMGLSVSGASFQSLFSNPLATPLWELPQVPRSERCWRFYLPEIFSLFSWLPCSWGWRRWPERA